MVCLAFIPSDWISAGNREVSLLVTGVMSQQLAMVTASLRQSAGVDARDELGRTLLMRTAFHGTSTILEMKVPTLIPKTKWDELL